MTPGITTTLRGHLLQITLDRPDSGNLLSAGMAEALRLALQSVGEEVRLVLLRGAGADFCRGRESPMPQPNTRPGSQPSAETLRRVVTAPPVALYDALKAVPVPTLAVVQGAATGVGCALAAACDLTLCTEDARFSVPELERDIPPTLVMSALAARVPLKTIAHLVLTREVLSAREALAAGLVTQVCAAEQLAQATDHICQRILPCSPVALRAVKTFLQLAPGMAPSAISALAAHLGATALSARFELPA